jgi:S1-C subfamily serine protease
MTNIDQVFDSVGLIIVVTEIPVVTYVGTGRRRRAVTNIQTSVGFGSGFIVDGNLENNLLKSSTSSDKPIVISVAHLIPSEGPSEGTSRYYLKLFDQTTKVSNIHPLNLETYNRSVDLCIFQFTNVPNNLQTLEWNLTSIKSGDLCYLVGYPLGDSQLSIVSGSVRDPTYCFTNLASGVDQIYHCAPATNGNSGSCILDKDGKIIGIHVWGYQQGSNTTFGNFSGGPSTKSSYHILSHMTQNKNLAVNKYYPRVTLGINAQILDDLFRIQNINNPNLINLDGIIVKNIFTNISTYTIHAHNQNLES